MEFFRIRHDIPFMRRALVFNVISIITFVVAVSSLATKGLNFGVDFTGGTVMEVQYPQPPDLDKIRAVMTRLGFADASVQTFGTSKDVLLRLPVKAGLSSAQLSEQVMDELHKTKINDAFVQNATIRPDGLLEHDMYIMEVKKPSESKGPWDYYKLLKTMSGEEAFGKLADSSCPIVKK